MFLFTISVLLAVEGYFAYQVKGICILYKKIKCYFRENWIVKDFDIIFKKKIDILLTHSSLLMVK